MDPQYLESSNPDIVPDLTPVDLPGRDGAPTIDERIAAIEDVLHIA